MHSRPPAVWRWYVAYCWLFVTLNLGWVVLGLTLTQWEAPLEPLTPDAIDRIGLVLAAKGTVFASLYAALPLLPRSPVAYGLHFANILFSAYLCATLPFAIALAVAWRRPEVEAWFGVPRGRDEP